MNATSIALISPDMNRIVGFFGLPSGIASSEAEAIVNAGGLDLDASPIRREVIVRADDFPNRFDWIFAVVDGAWVAYTPETFPGIDALWPTES